jgi:hypothetical protein
MRMHRWLRWMALLALVSAASLVPGKARATDDPTCLILGQECVGCGRGCEKLCTDYACDDGTSYSICGSCDCIRSCGAF